MKMTPEEIADVKALLMKFNLQELHQLAEIIRYIPEHVLGKLSEAERQLGFNQYAADVRAIEIIETINEFLKPIRAMLLTRNTNDN